MASSPLDPAWRDRLLPNGAPGALEGSSTLEGEVSHWYVETRLRRMLIALTR